ncbi:hypothetical protein E2C01_050628 [Portunus trituberculatus]|uniref:Uncharacterized protein n=1 Tax=Portunus trituberculatus TaxID=210409 RepID=A0A5B7GJI2_PORTR|nr:hypothetical protein [Portunus trituberculatus]
MQEEEWAWWGGAASCSAAGQCQEGHSVIKRSLGSPYSRVAQEIRPLSLSCRRPTRACFLAAPRETAAGREALQAYCEVVVAGMGLVKREGEVWGGAGKGGMGGVVEK